MPLTAAIEAHILSRAIKSVRTKFIQILKVDCTSSTLVPCDDRRPSSVLGSGPSGSGRSTTEAGHEHDSERSPSVGPRLWHRKEKL